MEIVLSALRHLSRKRSPASAGAPLLEAVWRPAICRLQCPPSQDDKGKMGSSAPSRLIAGVARWPVRARPFCRSLAESIDRGVESGIAHFAQNGSSPSFRRPSIYRRVLAAIVAWALALSDPRRGLDRSRLQRTSGRLALRSAMNAFMS